MSAQTIASTGIQMNHPSMATSPQVYAHSAGFLYLVITAAAMIAHFYVPSTLIVPGDAAATANQIMASESLFRIGGVGSELVILVSELILSVLLYVLLRPVNKTLSLIAAVSRLAMTTIHGINLLNYGIALLLVSGAPYLSVFSTDQLQALMMLFLDAHSFGFTIGIFFLTLHVFVLGYLIIRSGYIPRLLGALFLIAAVGYLIDSSALLLLSNYETPDFLALPIAAAEIAFPLWLLIKGVNADQWKKRALESS